MFRLTITITITINTFGKSISKISFVSDLRGQANKMEKWLKLQLY